MPKNSSTLICLLSIAFLMLSGCGKDEKNTFNHLPEARFEVNSYRGDVTTVFQFDGSEVSDAEDPAEILELRWDWNNDGIFDTDFSTEKIVTHQYTQVGLYFPLMEVRDSKGMLDETQKMLVVVHDINNLPPEFPYYVFPADWQEWIDPETIYFKWKCAGDPENDPLTFDLWFGSSEETMLPMYDVPATTEIFNGEEVYVTGIAGFDFEKTYFWQIYVKDPAGNHTAGPIWRFKTKAEEE